MLARYIPSMDTDVLLDPDGKHWRGARSEALALIGTPVGLQPAAPIIVAWATKKIGQVDSVKVLAVHDGSQIAFRLEWGDPSENGAVEDITVFPDAAAVLLPSAPNAPMATMGALGLPVNGWYWRADENDLGRQVVAEGIGTSRTVDTELVRGRGVWNGGRWRAVIARALRVQSTEPLVQLEAGQKIGFGVAIWEGNHMERGGIKAYSVDWRELRLEAAPTARR
jgi:DMSO reductase family type II enzyme heme b subunit